MIAQPSYSYSYSLASASERLLLQWLSGLMLLIICAKSLLLLLLLRLLQDQLPTLVPFAVDEIW